MILLSIVATPQTRVYSWQAACRSYVIRAPSSWLLHATASSHDAWVAHMLHCYRRLNFRLPSRL